jgi:hypothetical protein
MVIRTPNNQVWETRAIGKHLLVLIGQRWRWDRGVYKLLFANRKVCATPNLGQLWLILEAVS